MTVKWSKKKAIECLQELRNPFEEVNQNGQDKRWLPAMAERVKEFVTRSKEIKPQ